MRISIFFLLFISIMSCEPIVPLPEKVRVFLPDHQLLEEGLVWKYYVHRTVKGNDHPKTNIAYRHIKKDGPLLTMKTYNAGFDIILQQKVQVGAEEWVLKSMTEYFGDVFYEYEIEEPGFLNWGNGPATLNQSVQRENFKLFIEDVQESRLDTSIVDNRTMIFSGSRKILVSEKADSIIQEINYRWEQTWEEGKGLVGLTMENEELLTEQELVEIISIGEFEKRSNHGMHRVGYIDTTQVLDRENVFKTCGAFSSIYDYYNADIASFIGGKGSLKKLLETELDPKLLSEESGYLTFRFVINCNGKAGWWTTEEAGLDYAPKSFSSSCKNHLFEILSSVDEWKPLYLREEYKDAYTYLTFKLKDGKIIEILP